MNGILVVDKPTGWTSHDVVKKTKFMLGGKEKIGHTGTLDPIATGVLILLIGKATKSAKFFEKDDKRYLAEITFGYATDTFDRTGKTTVTGDPHKIDVEKLEKTIRSFEGETEQIPPMFSALKVGGKRLYKLAREGKVIELKPRKVSIRFVNIELSNYPIINLDIKCSKGTYVRALADQLGEKAGCPAHLSELKRIASGNYTIDEAVDFISLVESTDRNKIASLIRPIDLPEFK